MRKGKNTTTDLFRAKPVCHASYTLNNYQNVRCTIIGDEPLFYQDIDEDYDEDFSAIFDGLEESDYELDQCDLTDSALMEEDHYIYTAFDAAFNAPKSGNSLKDVMNVLQHSDYARAMLMSILPKNYQIVEGHDNGTIFMREHKTITVSPDLCFAEKMIALLKGLRRAEQHMNGALIDANHLHPDYAVLANRAQQADETAVLARVAWELRLANDIRLWMRLERSAMKDILYSFAREASQDFRSITSGEAMRAAFERWFLSERCLNTDRDLVQRMLSDQSTPMIDSPEQARAVLINMLSALGQVAHGRNYLAPRISFYIDDVLFTDVRDRSSANFLWFIKFERSFKDAEEAMAEQRKAHIEEIQESLKPAEIIQFPKSRAKKSAQDFDSSESAAVIRLSDF